MTVLCVPSSLDSGMVRPGGGVERERQTETETETERKGERERPGGGRGSWGSRPARQGLPLDGAGGARPRGRATSRGVRPAESRTPAVFRIRGESIF